MRNHRNASDFGFTFVSSFHLYSILRCVLSLVVTIWCDELMFAKCACVIKVMYFVCYIHSFLSLIEYVGVVSVNAVQSYTQTFESYHVPFVGDELTLA